MSLVVNALRAKDFLNLQFEFVNFELDESAPGAPRLVREPPGPAFIIIRLPPQHITEEAFPRGSSAPQRRDGFAAGASRLAFRIPDGTTEIPFTLQALLELVATLAPLRPDSTPDERPTSAIEFPRGLLIVPRESARLSHAAKAVVSAHTHWTELWHTNLHDEAANAPDARWTARFRAVPNPLDLDEFASGRLTALTLRDRKDIVTRSTQSADPHVIAAKRFTLSALGTTAHLIGDWPADEDPMLAAWDHEAVLGRDRVVRVAKHGFLFPFRHRATMVTVTQRTFSFGETVNVAQLEQQAFLTVHESEVAYTPFASAYPFAGREMPIERVRIAVPAGPIPVVAGSGRVRLSATALDTAGNLIDCALTMFFVESRDAADENVLNRVAAMFASDNASELGNQRMAIAEDAERKGETTLNVALLRFGVRRRPDMRGAPIHPPFLPFVQSADASIPAVEHLLNTTPSGGRKPITVELHPAYLANGFPAGDKKQVFATFAPGSPLTIPAERAGGLAVPTFKPFDGLSRVMGPVAGVNAFANDLPISAEELVGEAKLLGAIRLKDIIVDRIDSGSDAFDGVSLDTLFDKLQDDHVFLTRPVTTTRRTPTSIETRFLWKPKIRSDGLGAPLIRTGSGHLALILKGRITTSLAGASRPSFEVEGRLTNFALLFAEVVQVDFKGVEFRSGAGRKMSASIDFGGMTFVGKLAFVEKLATLFKSFGAGPAVKPLPDGVTIGYGIPIPAVPLGAMNLQNIALSLSVSLPFVPDRPAAVRFALSERSNPFLVSVSIFGGTGYFSLEVRTDKTVRFEAALEFGGVVALNLFIVKGGVYLFAGIFLALEGNGDVRISGHLRLGGYVDVLGLITVSIEVYIALEYDSGRNVLAGEGRLTVSVKVLFFSESFSFTVRKEIAGFGAAPIDRRMMALRKSAPLPRAVRAMPAMTPQQWQQYCAAFA